MQPRLIVAALIYLGSYLPLSAILLVQDFDLEVLSPPACTTEISLSSPQCLQLKHPIVALIFVVMCSVCTLITLLILRLTKTKRQVSIIEAKHIPADIINYTIPYIVSFMGLDYSSMGKIIGFSLFWVWMFWIIYASGQIMLNPVLVAFGWKLYEVKYLFEGSKNIHTGRILARGEILSGQIYRKADIQDVMIVHASVEE